MNKYIDANKLIHDLEERIYAYSEGYAEGDDNRKDAIETLLKDVKYQLSLQQEKPDDVCSVIKEYYGKKLPFEDERTKAAYHFFSAGRTFELKKIEEERVKHITDLLDNYQKGKKAGYKQALSELKEGKIECSPVIKELIDKLFGIGNTFNFGFGPKDFLQEKPEADLEKGLADYCHKYYNYDYPKQAKEGTGTQVMPHIIEAAKYFYELGRNSK